MNYAQDMEYDHKGNTMYAAAYSSTGSLYTVDLNTGLCTLVEDFPGGAEITGFAAPYCVDNNQWTGNENNTWQNPDNWTCGIVPGASDNVFISSNPSGGVFPVIGTGVTGTCFDIEVAHGADLIIQNGGTLNVINP